MIDEIVKTIRLHLSERLTSPLLGAFLFSWVAWNYRAVLVVLSSESVLQKFEIIDKIIYKDTVSGIAFGLVLPLVTALIYIFAYPYPAKYVYQFTRNKQREILDIRRRIEDETPLTIEDSKRLRSDLARAEQSYYLELDRKDAEIARLKSQSNFSDNVAQRDASASATFGGSNKVQENLFSPELIEMLKRLEAANGRLSESMAVKQSDLSRVEVEFLLGELIRLGLVSTKLDPKYNVEFYGFTHEGRAALLSARNREGSEIPRD